MKLKYILQVLIIITLYTSGLLLIEYGEPDISVWHDFFLDLGGLLCIIMGAWIQDTDLEE